MEKGSHSSDLSQEHIVFFDGVCHLCNTFVDVIITRDRHHRLKFAPLQGETAAQLLPEEMRLNLHSVVYFEAGHLHERSNAILKILSRLGGIYSVFGLGWILPRFIRDRLYNFIAMNRYAWFGQRDFCRLPTPEERAHLLP